MSEKANDTAPTTQVEVVVANSEPIAQSPNKIDSNKEEQVLENDLKVNCCSQEIINGVNIDKIELNDDSTNKLTTKDNKILEEINDIQSDDSNSASSSSTFELSNTLNSNSSGVYENSSDSGAEFESTMYIFDCKNQIGNRNKTKHELATGYGFNEDQIGIFEETFQIFDKDCDGFITLVEIRTVMNALGFFPGDDIIRKSIQDIDNDNSGTVDFEEFICMMSKFRTIKTTNELDEELKEIFKIFDKNQDGFIDKAELKDVLIRLGENITDDEVMDMIKEADTDGDSKVSFSEFRSILYDNKAR